MANIKNKNVLIIISPPVKPFETIKFVSHVELAKLYAAAFGALPSGAIRV
jgi:hypothetical protein